MGILIHIKRAWTKKEYASTLLDPGRPSGKPVGSYVLDLADLKKAIVLCPHCVAGFDPKPYKYHLQKEYPFVQGDCDACRAFSTQASLFLHESTLKGCWPTR